MVGKVAANRVPPSGVSRITQTRADKIERILVSYDNNSGMATLSKWYAWYLVLLGASAIGVMPDPTLKGPRYFVKDPRTVLAEPGMGSIPLTSTAYGMISEPMMHVMSMSRVILNETMTASSIVDQYGNLPGVMDLFRDHETTLTPYNLITYMDKDIWSILINEKTIVEVEHGLKTVPVRFTSMFVPEQLGGQGMFEQNIGLVLAYMRLLNQKLVYNQNIVWPWLVIQGLANMNPDTRVIEFMGDGKAEFLAPPGEIQVERDLETLDRLIRVMNHDTEVMQGEAPSSIFTATAADRLNADVRQTVIDHWDVMRPDLEFVKANALAIDEKIYGGRNKEIYGKTKGEQFEDKYTPSKDIMGYRNVTIDFGIGVGGLEGFTELMQLAAQGFIDEAQVMDNVPWITSTSETRRKVFLDRIEKVLFEMVAGQAPSPLINHMSQWRVAVENGNKDPYKWLAENPFPAEQEMLPGVGAPPPEAALGLPPPGGAPQPPGIPNIPSPSQLLALGQGRSR